MRVHLQARPGSADRVPERSPSWYERLDTRLSLSLLVLLLGLGVVTLGLALELSRNYFSEVQQRLNLDLAEHIVAEKLLLTDGVIQEDALHEIFHMMMVINPSLELYLLGPEGEILAYSAPPGRVVRERVALGPVQQFLDGAELPILGDDPRDSDGRKIFSSAPIRDDLGLQGYLYAVLASEQHDSVASLLAGSAILRSGAAMVAGSVLLALVGGLLLFRRLTRRLTALGQEMDHFLAEDDAVLRPRTGDELARLLVGYRAMRDRIQEQMEQLREKDRLRRELVANVSHDLRTPLTHLQGYLETLLLKEGLPAEERRQYLEIAARESARLGRLVGDLFELAKLDALTAPIEREPFSLAELAHDVGGKYRLDALRRGIALEVEAGPVGTRVEADLGLVERILENLLVNALKHTPEGGRITVSVQGDDREMVRLVVRDTGSGISPGELPHIFDRFQSGRKGGTGLGLAIARRGAQLHGGSLTCRSLSGRGTAFELELPRADPPAVTM